MTDTAAMPNPPRSNHPRLVPPERLWTIDEFARLWGRSANTVRRWIREGRIHTVKLGGATRIPNSEVLRLTSFEVDEGDEGEDRTDELIERSSVPRMLTGAAAN